MTAVRSLSTTRRELGDAVVGELTGGVEAQCPGERVRPTPVLGRQGEYHVAAHARTDLAARSDSSVRMSGVACPLISVDELTVPASAR